MRAHKHTHMHTQHGHLRSLHFFLLWKKRGLKIQSKCSSNDMLFMQFHKTWATGYIYNHLLSLNRRWMSRYAGPLMMIQRRSRNTSFSNVVRIWVNILTAHFTYMRYLNKPNINSHPVMDSFHTITIMATVCDLSARSNSITSTNLHSSSTKALITSCIPFQIHHKSD